MRPDELNNRLYFGIITIAYRTLFADHTNGHICVNILPVI
jgi:hypothetical protein